eukprot:3937426-Rhodomonas_salina.2
MSAKAELSVETPLAVVAVGRIEELDHGVDDHDSADRHSAGSGLARKDRDEEPDETRLEDGPYAEPPGFLVVGVIQRRVPVVESVEDPAPIVSALLPLAAQEAVGPSCLRVQEPHDACLACLERNCLFEVAYALPDREVGPRDERVPDREEDEICCERWQGPRQSC